VPDTSIYKHTCAPTQLSPTCMVHGAPAFSSDTLCDLSYAEVDGIAAQDRVHAGSRGRGIKLCGASAAQPVSTWAPSDAPTRASARTRAQCAGHLKTHSLTETHGDRQESSQEDTLGVEVFENLNPKPQTLNPKPSTLNPKGPANRTRLASRFSKMASTTTLACTHWSWFWTRVMRSSAASCAVPSAACINAEQARRSRRVAPQRQRRAQTAAQQCRANLVRRQNEPALLQAPHIRAHDFVALLPARVQVRQRPAAALADMTRAPLAAPRTAAILKHTCQSRSGQKARRARPAGRGGLRCSLPSFPHPPP